MIHHSKCPLCYSGSITDYLKCTDHFLTQETFELFKCTSCGFIFTQEGPDEKEAGRYYQSENYISHDDSAVGITGKIYFLVRRLMLVRKRGLITRVTGKKTGDLLDIGTGSGHFAGAMKLAGWNVTGIEPDRKAAGYAVSRFGLRIIAPEQISGLNDNCFDCITAWHTLEHSHDLFSYISDIKRLLRTGGCFIAALPSAASCDARYYTDFWAAWDVPRHLWHFTPDTFKLLAEKAGFEIIKTKRLPFDAFYISLLSEKYRGANLPFLSGMMKGLRFFISSIVKLNGSSSLIFVLKKKSEQ
ncbi:MAG TPA: class I SAM-dependent methyltransferase [Bacteroidales bacterium]|nr:class I SAM-dependent methyltransferase [Bacteroidales bacterium]